MAYKKIAYAEWFILYVYVDHKLVNTLSTKLIDASFEHKIKSQEDNDDVEFLVNVYPPNVTEAYNIIKSVTE